MRLPTYAELRAFVRVEGWDDKDKVARKKKGDHHRYTLALSTGEVLYTRISHGSGQIGDPSLWKHILRDQLRVTEKEFWRCVGDGVPPPRPGPTRTEAPGEVLDAKLVRNLIRRVGLPSAQVARMTRDEAVEAWNAYLGGSEG